MGGSGGNEARHCTASVRRPAHAAALRGCGSRNSLLAKRSAASAASSVFCISVATVIGPTPPGTGVIQLARCAAASNPTSPTRRPSSSRLMPTSITTAPGLTHSPGISAGRPTATTRMSALRTLASSTSGGVNLWQHVTVQPAISSSSAIGRPTWLLTPTIVALAPRTGRSVHASSVVMPRGVHGRRPNWRSARWPTFSGWKPSTSLRGSMRWISAVASRRSGSGSCTRMPCTSGSALRRSISASSSASLVSAGRSWSIARMPTFSAARRLLRT